MTSGEVSARPGKSVIEYHGFAVYLFIYFYSRGCDGGRIVDRYLGRFTAQEAKHYSVGAFGSLFSLLSISPFKGVAAFHITR